MENTDNWLWFVRMVKKDLGLDDGEGFILISDHQKVNMLDFRILF